MNFLKLWNISTNKNPDENSDLPMDLKIPYERRKIRLTKSVRLFPSFCEKQNEI